MLNKQFNIILFPPGMGGNHFKNLLGLYSGMYDRKEIVSVYDKGSTSHAIGNNLQKHSIIKAIKNYDNILLCGHIGEYLFLQTFFNQLRNRKFVMMGWDKKDINLIFRRFLKINYGWCCVEPFYMDEQQHLYDVAIISKLMNCQTTDVAQVRFSEFIALDNIHLLEFAARHLSLGTNHNVDVCKDLHLKWLNNNNLMAP